MNDNKQQPAKPDRAIPVRALYLDEPRMLPSGNMSDVILADEKKQQNKPRFSIEYIPSMQFYRVAYFAPSATTPTKVVMYPREWGSFEPVPQ